MILIDEGWLALDDVSFGGQLQDRGIEDARLDEVAPALADGAGERPLGGERVDHAVEGVT